MAYQPLLVWRFHLWWYLTFFIIEGWGGVLVVISEKSHPVIEMNPRCLSRWDELSIWKIPSFLFPHRIHSILQDNFYLKFFPSSLDSEKPQDDSVVHVVPYVRVQVSTAQLGVACYLGLRFLVCTINMRRNGYVNMRSGWNIWFGETLCSRRCHRKRWHYMAPPRSLVPRSKI